MVEAWELGVEVEPLGLWAEAESGPRRLEAKVRDTPAPAMLEDGRPAGLTLYRYGAEGERRGCQTTAVEEAGPGGRAGIFEEWALEDRKPPQKWSREPKTKEGLDGTSRDDGERRGGSSISSSVSQSISSPSMSSSPRCINNGEHREHPDNNTA